MVKDFYCKNWEDHVPRPVCDAMPQYGELYKKAWKIARDHVKTIDGMPQSPYMDEAFCDSFPEIFNQVAVQIAKERLI